MIKKRKKIRMTNNNQFLLTLKIQNHQKLNRKQKKRKLIKLMIKFSTKLMNQNIITQ